MDENVPPTLDKPSEDRGLFLQWPADPSVMINFHGFNPTDGELLRETWVNVWWEEDVLLGTAVGDPFVGFPVLDLTPPPAFATVP
jgi:hypothetical protein